LFIAIGVNLTGGIKSDLWLLYFIFIIAETLAASAPGFLVTDGAALLSYVIATWPRVGYVEGYVEILGTRIFFLVLVASIARTIAQEERRRQEDVAALREALSVSEERRRLARDLHDGIGHVLTRVIPSLEVARRQAQSDPAGAEECILQQANDLRGAMEEMRQVVATLRTDNSSIDAGISVRLMAAQLADSGALQVDVQAPVEPLPLSAHRQYHLSRVIQEALTNCLKHSGADRVLVHLQVVNGAVGGPRVLAEISDAGKGFDPTQRNGTVGHGLQGMSERLSPYGGKVTVESAPGRGTRVLAELPVDQEE
jgi:signal transduction histidine kinase